MRKTESGRKSTFDSMLGVDTTGMTQSQLATLKRLRYAKLPEAEKRATVHWRVNRMREELRLTMEGLGKLVGYSHGMISQIESGISIPSPEGHQRLAAALGVSVC